MENNFKTDSVFRIAAQTLPRLRSIEYELRAAEKQISAARGSVSPSITVGGAVYTGYYKVLSDDAGEQAAFSSQLKNNNSQAYMYLSISHYSIITLSAGILKRQK